MGLNLLLTFIFVTSFPQIIGQFVNHNIKMVNTIETLIAQVFIIVQTTFSANLCLWEKELTTSQIESMEAEMNLKILKMVTQLKEKNWETYLEPITAQKRTVRKPSSDTI